MDNKYYTPKIEEFHVGFEYQIKYNDPRGDAWMGSPKNYMTEKEYDMYNTEEFMSKVFAPATWEHLLHQYKGQAELRVKYLDKEDIGSLGWKFNKQYPGLEELSFDIGPNNFYLDYDLNKNYLRIFWEGDGDVTIFAGKIKNKSELSKLMKQLNIL